MKRFLVPALVAVSFSTPSAFAAPAAILTKVSGTVTVQRGAQKLAGKNGLQLQNGDKVTVSGGTATVFSLGGPPQTLKSGSLIVGASAGAKTNGSSVWGTVYKGLQNGLNKGDRRVAATMRPGEILPISPVGTIESARPTFEWQPSTGVARYEVTVKSGDKELYRAQTTGTKLPYPATSPALSGALTWLVTPLRKVVDKWEADGGASTPLPFQIATADQLKAVHADLTAAEAGLKTAAPAERYLTRAALWKARGFAEAATRELAKIPADPTAQELQQSIWLETGQGWRLPPIVDTANIPIGNARPQDLALAPNSPFEIIERKRFTAPDSTFSLDIPQNYTFLSFVTNKGATFANFASSTPHSAQIYVMYGPAAQFGAQDALLNHLKEMIDATNALPANKGNSFSIPSRSATTFHGVPARSSSWQAKIGGFNAVGGGLEWREGDRVCLVGWGGAGAPEAAALRALTDSIKFGPTQKIDPPKLEDVKKLDADIMAAGEGTIKAMDVLMEREKDLGFRHHDIPESPTIATLEELDKARLATPENSHQRADAAGDAARVAAKLGWIALDAKDYATADRLFERRAALDTESYNAEVAATKADIEASNADIARWAKITPWRYSGFSYDVLLGGFRILKEARIGHLRNIAMAQYDNDTFELAARQLFELRRAALAEQLLARESDSKVWSSQIAYADALDNLGDVAQGHADLEGGRAYFNKAIQWRRAVPAPYPLRDIYTSLRNLATLEYQLGETRNTRDYLQQALNEVVIATPARTQFNDAAAKDMQLLVKTEWIQTGGALLNNLGSAQMDTGDLAGAETSFQRALQVSDQMPTQGEGANLRDSLRAKVLNNLSVLHNYQGDDEGSGKYLTQAIEVLKKLGDDRGLALALFNGAATDYHFSKFDDANAKLNSARPLFAQLQMPRFVISTDGLAAKMARFLKDPARAAQLSQSALEMARNQKDYDGIGSNANTLALAKLDLLKGKPLTAEAKTEIEALLKEAQDADSHLSAPLSDISTLRARAHFAEANGDLEQALTLQTDAINRNERLRASSSSASFSEQEENYQLYDEAVAILLKLNRPEAAFDMLSRARSSKLKDSLKLSALKSNDTALQALLTKAAALDEKLAKTRAQLATETSLPAPQRDPAKLKNLGDLVASTQQEFFDVSAQIKAKNPRFEKALALSPKELKKAQRAIPEGALLLQYAALDDGLYIFAVTRDSLQIFAPKVSRDDLNKVVRDYRNIIDADVAHLQKGEAVSNIDDPKSPMRLASEKLSGWLLEPVQKEIDAAKTVAVIPSGELFYLPFHALGETVKGENGAPDQWRFLIESKPVAYLTAGDVLSVAQERDIANEGTGVLAMGDPTGANLPDAKIEAESVARLFPDSKALTGPGATKLTLLQPENRDKRVLHLAAHGVLNSANPDQSFIQLSPSGTDDGKLRVGEIVGLDLNKVDLVTLSACRTALGEGNPDGTEISSLAESFSSAGTPSVIASLWNVEDRSTARLMEVFYGALSQETPKGVALQRAQIALTKDPKTRQPVYWAPFELMGDWR